MTTQLDYTQVIKAAYDESINRLRVDAQINTTITGAIEVAINSLDDSIRISTASGTDLLINPDGTIGSLALGTVDGTVAGARKVFVNNVRQQILAAHDKQEAISYLDFGTKYERIVRIDFTSATFPGIIVRQDFTWTLVGIKYRLDSLNWSVL